MSLPLLNCGSNGTGVCIYVYTFLYQHVSLTSNYQIYSGMPLVVAWQSTSYGGKALEE